MATPITAQVLVVDDEENIRFLLAEALTKMGLHVETANNGALALEILNQQEFDLVLLDLQMPRVSGMEVLKKMHQLWPNTIVIILTAHASLETAIQALREGARDYLLKPCKATDLYQSITNGLHKRQEILRRYEGLKQVSAVAHDIRNVVTNIGLYTYFLDDADPSKNGQYLNTIKDQADQLGLLTKSMMEIPRLRAEVSGPTGCTLIDVNILAGQVVDANRARTAALDLKIIFEPWSEPLMIRGSVFSLHRLLNNLVINAIQYTPTGQIHIRTHPASNHAPGLENSVCIEVLDSGMGIDREDLPHLFQPYYRGRNAGQSKFSGQGLGLAIAKEAAEALGGRIEVESHLQMGSLFRVWLPLSNAA